MVSRLTFPRPARLLLALAALVAAFPAQAAVTITFWSHEFGNSFPHAFITLRGVPEAGGEPIDSSFGFTAKSVTPALLWGSVGGKVERPTATYIKSSDAQFSVVLTDAQYGQELALLAEWDDTRGGNSRYNLGKRNCVHFVAEAARRAGLGGLDHPDLMKKPRSYLQAVAAANPAAISVIAMHGSDYLATLPPLGPPLGPPPGVPPTPRVAPDLHVLPPPRADQPTGTISIRSSVDSNAG